MSWRKLNRVFFAAVVFLAAGAVQAVTIDLVPVGNEGNAADSTGYGAVSDAYNIGKYEVTVGQYVEFLNYKEIDKSTPLLMSPSALAANNIELDLSVNPFLFRTTSEYANNPVIGVSFWNACRFVNWLSNGQGDGETETGTYALNGYNDSAGGNISRNSGARWFIPTIDEWYKAAYYYTNDISHILSGGSDHGYFNDPTTASVYGVTFGYGTVDQYGNGWEWSESVVNVDSNTAGRILGGGNGPIDASVPVDFKGTSLGDPSRSGGPSLPWTPGIPLDNNIGFGFRVAQVPEPTTMVMLGLGSLALLYYWRKYA